MEKIELQDFDRELPQRMHVAVLMEKKPSSHPWADYSYAAIGVVLRDGEEQRSMDRVYQDGDVEHYLFRGLSIGLHEDECESYYHNLMSPEPGCFIIATHPEDDAEMPEPFLVSLSFDEAHAYAEGEAEVFSVPLIPDLYRWVEAYVLTHYVATRKTKRKLENWSDPQSPGDAPRGPKK